MLIDWFTVGAQALNFIILVWLMKRFLYKPILHAIDEREKRIAAELTDAAAKKAEAKKESEEFQRKNEEFDKNRAALLTKAQEDAKADGQRLKDEAQKAAEALKAKQLAAAKSEEQAAAHDISVRTQKEVFSIAGKALRDLAGVGLEERMIDVFIQKLRSLSADQKWILATKAGDSPKPVVVRTAFDVNQAQRDSTISAVKEVLGPTTDVKLETAPALISGMELMANGHKVAWSIAEYLHSMEAVTLKGNPEHGV
jgi:F-type H+-transporting ATPase subunit b